MADYRYERKFRLDGVAVQQLLSTLRLHPALFSQMYHPRWINNIYFDNPGFHSVSDNLDGLADRTKTRIRWYGDLIGVAQRPVLELKVKRGLVGRKDAVQLDAIRMDKALDTAALQRVWQQTAVPEWILLRLKMLRPVLINRYQRRYYRSADGNYRITIDSDMEFFPFRPRGGQFTQRAHLKDALVLELKYTKDAQRDVASIMANLPFRVSRNSKYLIGMQMTYPFERFQA